MKTFTVVLLAVLVSATAFGQSLTFTPLVSTKGIDTVQTYPGNDTVTCADADFAASIGDAVWGVGIPYGTVVSDTVNPSDSVLILSNYVTVGGVKTVHFGYYVHTTYASGDWIGWPVKVFPTDVNGDVTLLTASISDSTDGIGNTDIVFFESLEDSAGIDSAAAAWPKENSYKVLGAISLTTLLDLGTTRLLTLNNIQMVLPKHNLFFRVLAKAAYGPTLNTTSLRVHLNFKENQ